MHLWTQCYANHSTYIFSWVSVSYTCTHLYALVNILVFVCTYSSNIFSTTLCAFPPALSSECFMLPQGIWPFSYIRYKRFQKEITATRFGEVSDVHFESCTCPMQYLILFTLHVCVCVCVANHIACSSVVPKELWYILQLKLKLMCVYMFMTEWGTFPQSGFAVWLHYHVYLYSYWVLGRFQTYWHSCKLRQL